MWLIYAIGSAFFAGIMSVLAKKGIKNTHTDVITLVRTFFVLLFCGLFVFLKHKTFVFDTDRVFLAIICFSGVLCAVSWLCYFKALEKLNPNKVSAIEKVSTVIAVIFAIFIFNEKDRQALKLVGILIISLGIFIMSYFAFKNQKGSKGVVYAFASAFLTAASSLLSKIGVSDISSDYATFLRTLIVFFVTFIIVVSQNNVKACIRIPKGELIYIILSALATSLGWLCFYKALSLGEASLVIPIEKLSILFTVLFSYVIIKEKPAKIELLGTFLITVGTCIMII